MMLLMMMMMLMHDDDYTDHFLLLRRFQKPPAPSPVFTCTMEPGVSSHVSSRVSLPPRSTNVSIIDLYRPPQEPEFDTKSLRTFRETHFELGLSPPPTYSASVASVPGHTVFHCQHSCFTPAPAPAPASLNSCFSHPLDS